MWLTPFSESLGNVNRQASGLSSGARIGICWFGNCWCPGKLSSKHYWSPVLSLFLPPCMQIRVSWNKRFHVNMTWTFQYVSSSAKSLICNSEELFNRADWVTIYKKHRDNWGQPYPPTPSPHGNTEMQKFNKHSFFLSLNSISIPCNSQPLGVFLCLGYSSRMPTRSPFPIVVSLSPAFSSSWVLFDRRIFWQMRGLEEILPGAIENTWLMSLGVNVILKENFPGLFFFCRLFWNIFWH